MSRYYGNSLFKVLDLKLKYHYKNLTPFEISKEYQRKFPKKKHLYLYGETPLRVYEMMASRWDLGSNDRFTELGAGTYRGGLFLTSFFQCDYVGVEWLQEYAKFAMQLKKMHKLKPFTIICDDLFNVDLKDSNFIYLFGTCLKKDEIQTLCQKFSKECRASNIITVSFPLSDYSTDFITLDQMLLEFEFGLTTVYLQRVKC